MIDNNEKKVYRDLYDIVARNMNNSGRDMEIDKDLFATYSMSEPHQINTREMMGISKKEFVTAAFLLGLNRYPEEGAVRAFEVNATLSDEEYKFSIINGIVQSDEFAMASGKVVNNDFAYKDSNVDDADCEEDEVVEEPDEGIKRYIKAVLRILK